MNRLLALATLSILAACSQADGPGSRTAERGRAAAASPAAGEAFGLLSQAGAPGSPYEARIKQLKSFARLPDRGELLSYATSSGRNGRVVDGAYTWNKVQVSEENALRAIAGGHLRLMSPSGQPLDFRYDRHVEHPSGDLTWIGHIEGAAGAQAILTFGADAVYGTIGQPGKRSLRLTMRDGEAWVVETDPALLAASTSARPRGPDYLAAPKASNPIESAVQAKLGAPSPRPSAAPSGAMAAEKATAIIDVAVGYTGGLASRLGGASAAMTRINDLVAHTNVALANSQVDARVRLVHSMQVSYADTNENSVALEELTGFDSDSQTRTTPNAAFNGLRSARDQYGADLVVLLRPFLDPEQDGCGIAWLIGGAKEGVSPNDGQDYFGYAVVSDGQDGGYFCRKESFAHELGHLMGSAHDRESAEGDDGDLDNPDDYGAYDYSFGYKTSAAAGNFYTVMAYGDTGQQDYLVYSNPRITFCGNLACGTAAWEDNARSLNQIAPVVAGFRATAVVAGNARSDVNGDGKSDLLWYQPARVLLAYWLLDGNNVFRNGEQFSSSGYSIMATGDFNGDKKTDIIWRGSAGDMQMWQGNGTTFDWRPFFQYPAGWQSQGAHDIDGDGRSDLVWYQPARGLLAYWIMNGNSIVRHGEQQTNGAYSVRMIGDFSGDKRADIIWLGAGGDMQLWQGNGTTFDWRPFYQYPQGWTLVSADDVDADGRSDLIWHQPARGLLAYWIMNGNVVARNGEQVTSTRYSVASTGDYNGDGRADIIWLGTGGDMQMWQGNGVSFDWRPFYAYPGGGWNIVR